MLKKSLIFLCAIISFYMIWIPNAYAANNQSFQEQMKEKITQYIENEHAYVTLSYENLITGEKIDINGDHPSAAASTIKLPLALYLINQVNKGEVKLDEKLTYHAYEYYGGSGVIQYDPVGTAYTIEELLKNMLIHSDNIAFIMLKKRLGRERFMDYIKEIGGEYAYPNGHNLTSPDDLLLYLSELYKKAKTDDLAKKVVNWLMETDYNEALPKKIQQKVAHKVGMIPMNQVSNDAGIIFDNQPYVLAIMTEGFPYDYSKKVIADLANIVNEEHKHHDEAYYKIPTKTILVMKVSYQWFQPFKKGIKTSFLSVVDSFHSWMKESNLGRDLYVHSQRIKE